MTLRIYDRMAAILFVLTCIIPAPAQKAVASDTGIQGAQQEIVFTIDESLEPGAEIHDTQSSMIFEDMIGKLVTNLAAQD